MSKLSELIRQAKEEVVEPETGRHTVVIAGTPVELVFTKLEPMEWRDLIAQFPPRDDVVRDRNLGYNFDLAPSGYPVTHVRAVVDGEESSVGEDEWGDIFAQLESPDLFTISTLLWGLHEWEPQQVAKKVLRAAKKK